MSIHQDRTIANLLAEREQANELLRAARDLLRMSRDSAYVLSLGELKTKANGGGDGYCVLQEIEDHFDQYDIDPAPQLPEIED